ncbi:hypothetical protein IAU59_003855 [Kwoniella sp. CBS 9459]
MISIDLKGKVVLVTGGGRGIGLAITRSFAEAGATLAITYTSTDPSSTAKDISREFNVPVHVYHCDAEDSKRTDEMIEQISKDVGEIDIVVANAGVALWQEAVDMTDDELFKIMQVNLFAPFYLSRAAVRKWLGLPTSLSLSASASAPSSTSSEKDQGAAERGQRDTEGLKLGKKIIIVSSISGLVSMMPQAQCAYNASKAGVTMLAKSLAGEWAKYGITVNTVSPGYIQTEMIASPPPGQESWVSKWHDLTPVGRFGQANEIGDTVVMMASGRGLGGGFATGSDVVIDGGYTIY